MSEFDTTARDQQSSYHGHLHDIGGRDEIPGLRILQAEAVALADRLVVDEGAITDLQAIASDHETRIAALEANDLVQDGDIAGLLANAWFKSVVAATQHFQPSGVTFTNVTNMLKALSAGQVLDWEMLVWFVSGATPDMKIRVNAPAGATGSYFGQITTGGVVTPFSGAAYSVSTFVLDGTGGLSSVWLRGTVLNGGTPGNLQLQAAQNVSDAAATDIVIPSVIYYRSLP